jgi:hypothetical protein
MKTVLLLVALTATAAADGSGAGAPSFRARPAPPACTAKGASIIEIEVAFDAMGGQPGHSTTTAVYANGAWTRLRRDDHQRASAAPSTGCLDKKQLDAVQADLKAATWKITHKRITCKAISARHVIYRIAGTQKWDSHVCGADVVDDVTAKALADIDTQLAGLPDVEAKPQSNDPLDSR